MSHLDNFWFFWVFFDAWGLQSPFIVMVLNRAASEQPVHYSKFLILCSTEGSHSYRFGTMRGWVNNDRIFVLFGRKEAKMCECGWVLGSRSVFVCRDSVKCCVWTVGTGLMEFYARLSCMPASQYGSSLKIKIECTPKGCEREGSETGACGMGRGDPGNPTHSFCW